MIEVNNPITELLDEMVSLSAKGLRISDAWHPVFFSGQNILETKTKIRIPTDELVEDLAALGFIEWQKSYFQYGFEPGNEMFLVFEPQINKEGLKLVVFTLLARPTTILRRLLAVTNPVTDGKFQEHAYAPRGSFHQGTAK